MTNTNSNPSENEKVNIWSTENNLKQENQNTTKLARKPSKKRWGIRHAVYAFLLSLVLQTVVTIPFLIISTVNLASKGVLDPQKYQANLVSSLETGPGLFFAQISMYVAWFAVGLYVTYRLGLHSLAKDFWFRFKWGQDIALGILLGIGLRLFESLSFWILTLLGVNLAGADNSTPFTQGKGIWEYILLFGVVSFIGPISEEFLFRGLLLQGLLKTFRKRTFTPRTRFGAGIQKTFPNIFTGFIKYKEFLFRHKYILSVIISALAFGIMHFQGTQTFGQWLVVIETGSIGLIFALVVLRTRRLGITIIAHMIFNFSAVAFALWY